MATAFAQDVTHPDNLLTLLLGLTPHTSFFGKCHDLVWIPVSRFLIVVVYFIGP